MGSHSERTDIFFRMYLALSEASAAIVAYVCKL
jgi:hypothetical protein